MALGKNPKQAMALSFDLVIDDKTGEVRFLELLNTMQGGLRMSKAYYLAVLQGLLKHYDHIYFFLADGPGILIYPEIVRFFQRNSEQITLIRTKAELVTILAGKRHANSILIVNEQRNPEIGTPAIGGTLKASDIQQLLKAHHIDDLPILSSSEWPVALDHKWMFQLFFQDTGLLPQSHLCFAGDPSSYTNVVSKFGDNQPVILKPVNYGNGRGIVLLKNKAQLIAVLGYIKLLKPRANQAEIQDEVNPMELLPMGMQFFGILDPTQFFGLYQLIKILENVNAGFLVQEWVEPTKLSIKEQQHRTSYRATALIRYEEGRGVHTEVVEVHPQVAGKARSATSELDPFAVVTNLHPITSGLPDMPEAAARKISVAIKQLVATQGKLLFVSTFRQWLAKCQAAKTATSLQLLRAPKSPLQLFSGELDAGFLSYLDKAKYKPDYRLRVVLMTLYNALFTYEFWPMPNMISNELVNCVLDNIDAAQSDGKQYQESRTAALSLVLVLLRLPSLQSDINYELLMKKLQKFLRKQYQMNKEPAAENLLGMFEHLERVRASIVQYRRGKLTGDQLFESQLAEIRTALGLVACFFPQGEDNNFLQDFMLSGKFRSKATVTKLNLRNLPKIAGVLRSLAKACIATTNYRLALSMLAIEWQVLKAEHKKPESFPNKLGKLIPEQVKQVSDALLEIAKAYLQKARQAAEQGDAGKQDVMNNTDVANEYLKFLREFFQNHPEFASVQDPCMHTLHAECYSLRGSPMVAIAILRAHPIIISKAQVLALIMKPKQPS